jgi:SAM-dependent methyltransferase
MPEGDVSKLFDAHYFASSCGRPYRRDETWLGFFDSIAARIVSDIQPESVLDAGCALGFLVEKLRQRGVEAFGLDISNYAIQNVHPDIQPYCWIGSVAEPFPQKYDLIVCIEVLEHLDKAGAESAVANLCRHSHQVLFSSTPFDYKEATHFNVQPPEYWAELFARQGFFRDIDFDASFLTPWAVLYRRKQALLHRMVRDYERKFFLLWKENADLRELTVEMRDQVATLSNQAANLSNQVVELDREMNTVANQLRDIRESRSWKFIQGLQNIRLKLIPQNTGRERLLFKLLGKK